jgi:hypothetical protein
MRPHRRRDHAVRAKSTSAGAWHRLGPLRPRRLSSRRLDELIERAIVDAYGPSEQAVGFHATLEQELALPFETVVLGVTVSVKKLDITDREEVVAICSRGRERQAIPLQALPLPEPPPAGWEWIEAYRRWARGKYAAGKAR